MDNALFGFLTLGELISISSTNEAYPITQIGENSQYFAIVTRTIRGALLIELEDTVRIPDFNVMVTNKDHGKRVYQSSGGVFRISEKSIQNLDTSDPNQVLFHFFEIDKESDYSQNQNFRYMTAEEAHENALLRSRKYSGTRYIVVDSRKTRVGKSSTLGVKHFSRYRPFYSLTQSSAVDHLVPDRLVEACYLNGILVNISD